MKRVDRAHYCRDSRTAYNDSPQVIGYGATISAPHMHGFVLESLEPFVQAGSKVLDVGSGSGYLCACFAELLSDVGGGTVIGVEHIEDLSTWSIENLERDGKKGTLTLARDGEAAEDPGNISPPSVLIVQGDGYAGYAKGGEVVNCTSCCQTFWSGGCHKSMGFIFFHRPL